MNATELMKKVINEIENHGLKCAEQNYSTSTEVNKVIGATQLHIEEVYRHNGTDENVSVNIECYEITSVFSSNIYRVKRRGNVIKVPKNASDKVIKNRVEKAIALMNN